MNGRFLDKRRTETIRPGDLNFWKSVLDYLAEQTVYTESVKTEIEKREAEIEGKNPLIFKSYNFTGPVDKIFVNVHDYLNSIEKVTALRVPVYSYIDFSNENKPVQAIPVQTTAYDYYAKDYLKSYKMTKELYLKTLKVSYYKDELSERNTITFKLPESIHTELKASSYSTNINDTKLELFSAKGGQKINIPLAKDPDDHIYDKEVVEVFDNTIFFS